MPIPLPHLDDRSYDQLVEQALKRAAATCPEWTDFSPGDPGVTLLELFAFLTEALLYRLNRVPPKLRLALLRLAGVTMRPPCAAAVDLVFTRRSGTPADKALTIPVGTAIASADGSVQFLLAAAVTIPAGKDSVSGRALHCEQVEAELLGLTSGAAGQAFSLARAPVIASSQLGSDFVLGVEIAEGVAAAGMARRSFGDKVFEIWSEVPDFAQCGEADPVFILDRAAGAAQFGPPRGSEIGAGRIPAPGLEVRAWYRRGGGRAGNVAAGILTSLKGGPEGVEVTNPERAGGGRDGETLAELERRAPTAMSALRTAVTARDYEQIVLDAGGFAKAHAFAQAQVWRHAEPGVVEIAAMPLIDATSLPDGAVTPEVVHAHRTAAILEPTAAALDRRCPLGVRASIKWASVMPVSVRVNVMVGSDADPAAVEQGVRRRINALFSPMRDAGFGQPLRASEVYEQILGEPGVRYADGLGFSISETPACNVRDLVCDPAQPDTWFAVAGSEVNRSLDNAQSWSAVYRASEAQPLFVRRHPLRPGLTVLAVGKPGEATILISEDLGESWSEPLASFPCNVSDAAWIEREGKPMLLLATEQGLRQLIPASGSGPAAVIVDKAIDNGGFYAVAASTSPSGVISVAVAARATKGVYLSSSGGVSETFKKAGLEGKDVRALAVQNFAARTFLWAPVAAEAGAEGEGAFRLELRADGAQDPEGFKMFNLGWKGGSCEAIAFAGSHAFAGSNRAGLHVLDTAAAKPTWVPASPASGLPIRDSERFYEVVEAVAARSGATGGALVFAGGVKGVYASSDLGETFSLASASSFADRVPLPARWLYCASKHHITVVRDEGG